MKETEFLQELKEIDLLRQTYALLDWNAQTGMPDKAAEERSAVSSYIYGQYFEKLVGPTIKEAMAYFPEHQAELSAVGQTVFQVAKRDYDQYQAVPPEKMVAYTAATSRAHQAWAKARETKNFADFQEALADNIRLTKELIPFWQKAETTPYDVLLNQYEPHMTTEKLDAVFSQLREGIIKIRKALEKGTAPDTALLSRKMTKEQQRKFVTKVVADLGYDFSRGRLDDTIHPFATGINHHDVRLTTRWHEEDFAMGIMGVMHEAGHGMYEQGILEKYAYTPVHEGASMGIHESQSLFNEIIIGSDRSFWQKQYPFFQECAEGTFDDVAFEDFYRALKNTKASLIRIEADGLTYCLHIIIRYEMEKLIFNGEAAIQDLPTIWNDKYEEYLGIRPTNDLEGILQDVHWSGGMFGYFPSYALGYMYAAQLHHAMNRSFDVSAVLASDDYSPILDWLREHIHQYGRSKEPNELIVGATGEELNPQYLLDFLEGLYFDVYRITK